MKKIFRYAALFAGIILVQAIHAQQFTIPVFPDTQVAVGHKHEMYYSQIDWLVNHHDSLSIPMTLHVGDVVNFDNFNHWEVASMGFDRLDKAHMPYAITLGNHDSGAVQEYGGSAAPGNVNQNLRNTDKFNAYFPSSRFRNQRGRYEEGKSDNAYYTFKKGETNWLVMVLEFCPRQGAINWAGDIISRYYNYNVIILTHYYLTGKGEIAQSNAGYGDFSPQSIYEKLVHKYPNVLMVLSGHVVSSAYKADQGEKGNTVHQLLQNYQHEDYGGGYIRLLDIDIDKQTIHAKMYSPYYDKVKNDSSQFVIENVKFLKVDDIRR